MNTNTGKEFNQRVHITGGQLRETSEDKIQSVAGSIPVTFTDTPTHVPNDTTGIIASKAGTPAVPFRMLLGLSQ